MTILTDPRCCAFSYPGHPERPARIHRSVQLLRQQQALPVAWSEPMPVDDETLLRAHTPEHLVRLEDAREFDMDTPFYPDIAAHARRGVGGALRALALARQGEPAFSLLRPPGHHSTSDQAMGFCYLNSVAVAALEALATGFERVAVFDFDVHHGNGTEEILLDRPGCAFFSIHQFPAYPGTGRRHLNNCHNYPVPPGLSRAAYREVAVQALAELESFKPQLIAISAGFDAYSGDPLCQQQLEVGDYHWFGTRFREFGVPLFSVLEGGYSDHLPELILAYLQGLEGRALETALSDPPQPGPDVNGTTEGRIDPPRGATF
jgi:acetoin utilization deacetylase AcuC-like enzyme